MRGWLTVDLLASCPLSLTTLAAPNDSLTNVSALNQPSLVGASWGKDEAAKRLEAAIAYEEEWLTNRALAMQAKATASSGASSGGGGEAPAAPVPEQENGAPARRGKRSRGAVDYAALDAEVQKEEQAEKKAKVEEGEK